MPTAGQASERAGPDHGRRSSEAASSLSQASQNQTLKTPMLHSNSGSKDKPDCGSCWCSRLGSISNWAQNAELASADRTPQRQHGLLNCLSTSDISTQTLTVTKSYKPVGVERIRPSIHLCAPSAYRNEPE